MGRKSRDRPERLLRKSISAEAELWCDPQFAVEHGPIAEKILEAAQQRKADLIVLGVHRPSGFPGAATHLPMATRTNGDSGGRARCLRSAAERAGSSRWEGEKMYTYSRLLDHPLALDARIEFIAERRQELAFPTRGVHRYPAQYVSRWKMKNGEETVLRPIRPDDEPLMANFHKTLSDKSVYLRYFHMESLSARVANERLIRKCFVDYGQGMALVAERTVPETGQHEILAVGRLSKMPGSRGSGSGCAGERSLPAGQDWAANWCGA